MVFLFRPVCYCRTACVLPVDHKYASNKILLTVNRELPKKVPFVIDCFRVQGPNEQWYIFGSFGSFLMTISQQIGTFNTSISIKYLIEEISEEKWEDKSIKLDISKIYR